MRTLCYQEVDKVLVIVITRFSSGCFPYIFGLCWQGCDCSCVVKENQPLKVFMPFQPPNTESYSYLYGLGSEKK